jgi:hypothetical protein
MVTDYSYNFRPLGNRTLRLKSAPPNRRTAKPLGPSRRLRGANLPFFTTVDSVPFRRPTIGRNAEEEEASRHPVHPD